MLACSLQIICKGLGMHVLLHNGTDGLSGSGACKGKGEEMVGDEGGDSKVEIEGVSSMAVCLLPMGSISNFSPSSGPANTK